MIRSFPDKVLVFQYGMKKMGKDQRDQPDLLHGRQSELVYLWAIHGCNQRHSLPRRTLVRHDSGNCHLWTALEFIRKEARKRDPGKLQRKHHPLLLSICRRVCRDVFRQLGHRGSIAHPKVVQIELPCPNCRQNGRSLGYTMHKSPDGDMNKVQCTQCQGSGLLEPKGNLLFQRSLFHRRFSPGIWTSNPRCFSSIRVRWGRVVSDTGWNDLGFVG